MQKEEDSDSLTEHFESIKEKVKNVKRKSNYPEDEANLQKILEENDVKLGDLVFAKSKKGGEFCGYLVDTGDCYMVVEFELDGTAKFGDGGMSIYIYSRPRKIFLKMMKSYDKTMKENYGWTTKFPTHPREYTERILVRNLDKIKKIII